MRTNKFGGFVGSSVNEVVESILLRLNELLVVLEAAENNRTLENTPDPNITLLQTVYRFLSSVEYINTYAHN